MSGSNYEQYYQEQDNQELFFNDMYTPKSNYNANEQINDEEDMEDEKFNQQKQNLIPIIVEKIEKLDTQLYNYIQNNDSEFQSLIQDQNNYQVLTYQATMLITVYKNQDNENFLDDANIFSKFIGLARQICKYLNPFRINGVFTKKCDKQPFEVNFLVEFIVKIGYLPEIHNKPPHQVEEITPQTNYQFGQNYSKELDIKSYVQYILILNPQYNEFPKHFEDLAIIGNGCFGEVHLVKYMLDHNLYALKKIKLLPQAIHAIKTFNENEAKQNYQQNNNIVREILFLKRMKEIQMIHHPNIVRLHKYWLQENTQEFFILLDYFGNIRTECHTIFDYFQDRTGQFKPQHRDLGQEACKEVISQIFYQALQAIQYIHSQNIVHRDIKDDNFLIKRIIGLTYKQHNIPFLFQVALCDFGLSGYGDRTGSLITYDQNEFRDRENIINYPQACDIYSLGVLLERLILLYNFSLQYINCIDDFKKQLMVQFQIEYRLSNRMKAPIQTRPKQMQELINCNEFKEWLASIPPYIPLYFDDMVKEGIKNSY